MMNEEIRFTCSSYLKNKQKEMALDNMKLILLLSILISFLSCKGQIKTESTASQSEANTMLKLDKKTWSIYQDENNNYWFGSNGNGVFYYDGRKLKKYTKEDGLVDNTIRGIQGDHLGNVYIQTPEGISKYDGKTFSTLQPIISSSNKWKLEPNDLWFNCNGNPNDIYRYDGESLFELTLPRKNLDEAFDTKVQGLSFKNMNSSPYSVFGIDKDKAGNLWIGTVVAGAFRYDGKSFLWFPEKELSTLPDGRVPGVRSMIEDKDGYFWLSNFISKYKVVEQGGIVKYEKLKGIDSSNAAFQNRIGYFNSGVSDNNGDLWMITYTGGVWKYDGKKLVNFSIMDDGTEVLLISIYKDNRGVLWLGTDNAGVFKYDGKRFVKFEVTAQ